MTLRAGVIGTGALGRHHVRILSELDGVELVGVCDARPEIAAELAARHETRVFGEAGELLRALDAVVLAVPTRDHAALACQALAAGVHVLVEKPMATTLEEADRMVAAAGGLVLAVGHVEFHNPAVQRLLSTAPAARFLEIERLSTFSPRSLDVDVLLDLMIHDLQILQALDPTGLREVRAAGIAVLSDRVDIASARLELESGCVANLTASRISDLRVRRLRMFSHEAYHSLDYQEQTIKGFRLEGGVAERRIVPADLPVERDEPLRRELLAFVARCRGEDVPLVDGVAGRAALALALEVQRAIVAHAERAAPRRGQTRAAE
ncbi:MAG TPA: Gfo/Idh/MocA family oxidoreductase [Thermoanaerobaculia bacterium]|nr:Gfo/Idh/MocA family oxidoreductase [Thermoanaerobaculia bacterium]